MSIAGERLYPAHDQFHDPEPDMSPLDDEGSALLSGERFGWYPMENGLRILYSPGESLESWNQRSTGRAAAKRERERSE